MDKHEIQSREKNHPYILRCLRDAELDVLERTGKTVHFNTMDEMIDVLENLRSFEESIMVPSLRLSLDIH